MRTEKEILKLMKQAIIDYINDDKSNNELYNKVFSALKKHDGDKVTKRFTTTVQATLGENYDVYYSHQYGMYSLKIRKRDESSDKYKDFLLGHESNPVYVFLLDSTDTSKVIDCKYVGRGFDYNNTWAGRAALERIEKNTEILKSGKIEKLAKLTFKKMKIDKEIEDLNIDSFNFPARFSVDRIIKGVE